MGRTHSKEKAPNDSKLGKTKKEQKQQKNMDRRKRKHEKQSKLDKLKQPVAPVVISRTHMDYDAQAKERLKQQLLNDSETFLLNQLMLSIQFFGNYEREMLEAVDRNSKNEKEETQKISRHFKTIVLPDRIHEAIDRKVKYQSRHGLNKSLSSLHTPVMYVVHDNIEVTHPGEIYSIITDAPPVYKFEIELPQQKGKRKTVSYHSGYIKLRSLESPKIYGATGNESSYQTNKQDELGNQSDGSCIEISEPSITTRPKYRDSIMMHAKLTLKSVAKKPCGFLNGKALSTNSTCSTSPTSSEYDYAYITALNTHQPLSIMRHGCPVENKSKEFIFIESCITNAVESIYKSHNEYSTAGDYSDDCNGSHNEFDFIEYNDTIDDIHYSLEERQYLNSKEFLSYFINLFQDGLGNDMGFSKFEIEQATWKGPVIYTPSWEIIPAIWCPWPKDASIGYESCNNRNNIRFQWPTPAMKQKIRTRGCHVVPIGYTPKLGCNLQRELEWKVVFPEAERYLESCLTNAQAKIYMVTKTLVKTFIDPQLEDRFNMFTIEHIRTHLFWECETNYTAWPDENLGESLIKFLNSFLVRVKTHNLPDYFLKNRNLFENIPERVLAELHKRIYRITENPVMHLLLAFRNLKLSKDFYPKLKFRKLYSTLVVDDPMKIINPQLTTILEKNLQLKDDNDVAFGSMAAFERTERHLRQRRTKMVRFMEAEKSKKDKEINDAKRLSVESIDIKIKIQKKIDEMRQKILLEFFIRHFIEMAQSAQQFKAHRLVISYAKHLERLMSVMNDIYITIDEANDVNLEIQKLLMTSLTALSYESNEPPKLPRRESAATIDAKDTISNCKKKNQGQIKVGINRYTNIDTPVTPVNLDEGQSWNYRKNRMETPTIEEEHFGCNKPSQIIINDIVVHRVSTSNQDIVNISLNELLGNVKAAETSSD